jgi:rhodanese-related sulfurtransferase
MQDYFLFLQHHLALTAAVIGVILLAVVIEFIRLQRGAKRLSPAEAVMLINRAKAAIIDVRTPAAFATGHITAAISLSATELADSKKIERLRNQPVIVVAATEADAARSATVLQQRGFDSQLLAGGINAWRDAGLPLVKG